MSTAGESLNLAIFGRRRTRLYGKPRLLSAV